MNVHKFCFIICANDERYLEECLWYVDRLSVPEGYEKERIVIRGAVSMTSGYNQAIRQTDAKYKIYMHQDVLLVNRDLLSELLDAFRDSSVGMVGIIGKKQFMASAEYSRNWDAGTLELFNGTDAYYINHSSEGKRWVDVTATDGMFMATQYDLAWDEEGFTGWDFYDISQSIRFQKAGYRIVVPCIENIEGIWVFHNAGQCEYDMWEKCREIFCKKYETEGYRYTRSEWTEHREEQKAKQQQVMAAFERGDFNETGRLLLQLESNDLDSKLAYVAFYLVIIGEEMKAYGGIVSKGLQKFEEFVNEYDEVSFVLRRFYFKVEDDSWDILSKKLREERISMKWLWAASHQCVADPNRLWWRVFAKYEEEIRSLMREGEILEAEKLLSQLDKNWRGKDGSIFFILIRVFRREVEKGVRQTVFDLSQDPDDLVRHFIRLKLYLRRVEFGLPELYQHEVYEYCVQTGVSDHLIFQILQNNIFYKEQFCRNLAQLFEREEGAGSMRAELYNQLAESEGKKEAEVSNE